MREIRRELAVSSQSCIYGSRSTRHRHLRSSARTDNILLIERAARERRANLLDAPVSRGCVRSSRVPRPCSWWGSHWPAVRQSDERAWRRAPAGWPHLWTTILADYCPCRAGHTSTILEPFQIWDCTTVSPGSPVNSSTLSGDRSAHCLLTPDPCLLTPVARSIPVACQLARTCLIPGRVAPACELPCSWCVAAHGPAGRRARAPG
jgi:hypothetical protein